jgi:hypothetical protein
MMNKIRAIFILIVAAIFGAIAMTSCTKEDDTLTAGNEPSTNTENETSVSLTGTEWNRHTEDTIVEGDLWLISVSDKTLRFVTDDYGMFINKIYTYSNTFKDTIYQNHDDRYDYTFDGKRYGTMHVRNIQDLSSITMDYTFEYSSDGQTLTLSANGKEGDYKRAK